MSNFSALFCFLSILTNVPVEQNSLRTEHKALCFEVWQQLVGTDTSLGLPSRSPELLVTFVSLQPEQPHMMQVEMPSNIFRSPTKWGSAAAFCIVTMSLMRYKHGRYCTEQHQRERQSERQGMEGVVPTELSPLRPGTA